MTLKRTARTCSIGVSLLALAAAACSSSSPPGGNAGTVNVTGLLVAVRSAPAPVAGVTISVIDPVSTPILQARTDAHGQFNLPSVPRNANGKVRLFVNGLTGVGGPYITWNLELAADSALVDLGSVPLVELEPGSLLTPNLADLTTLPDGRTRATLRSPIDVTGGLDAGGGMAKLSLPSGTVLTFPPASPIFLGATRLPTSALPIPMPTAGDGSPRFTGYLVTLQPAGVELDRDVQLELPEIDGASPGSAVEFWEGDVPGHKFNLKGTGAIATRMVQSATLPFATTGTPPFIRRFDLFGAMPTCRAQTTDIVGKTVNAANMPVAGVTVSAFGFSATSAGDGTFRVARVALGCTAPSTFEVLASLRQPSGVLLSGSSGLKQPTPGADTNIGDLRLATPFYVVRARPASDMAGVPLTGVPVTTTFDVYFSEAIDSMTLDAISMEQQVSSSSTSCQFSPVSGHIVLDDRDATHVRLVPDQDLQPGTLYAGKVDAARLRSVAQTSLTHDFRSAFVTLSTIDQTPPSNVGLLPPRELAFGAGTPIFPQGTATDNVAVTSARFRLCGVAAGANMCDTSCTETPAVLTNTDLCFPNRNVGITGQIMLPNFSSEQDVCIQLVARDDGGNEATSSPMILSVVPPGVYFPFCGAFQPKVVVSSNGFITFDAGTSVAADFTPTAQEFFQYPRISALWTDLDLRPTSQIPDARIFTHQVAAADPGFAITWWNTGLFSNLAGPDTFQIVLFRSGAIQISYAGIADVVPSLTRSFYMGISCPGTPTQPLPAKTALLTGPNSGRVYEQTDVPWNGEPIFDYVDAPTPITNEVSQAFDTRVFNFTPSSAQTPAVVPIFSPQDPGGTDVPNIACDDCYERVDIRFPGGQALDGGPAPDASISPDSDVIN